MWDVPARIIEPQGAGIAFEEANLGVGGIEIADPVGRQHNAAGFVFGGVVQCFFEETVATERVSEESNARQGRTSRRRQKGERPLHFGLFSFETMEDLHGEGVAEDQRLGAAWLTEAARPQIAGVVKAIAIRREI